MKARIIHTKFYASERVLGLSQQARWLFMYYLTCDGIGLTGAFKWSTSKTIFETGLDTKGLVKAKNELQASKLAYFYQDWVIIPGTDEKNNFNSGSKTSSGYEKELNSLPQPIKDLLLNETEENTPMIGVSEYSATADTPRIHKPEIRNQNSLESAENLSFKTLDSLTNLVCAEVASHYRVKAPDVLAVREELNLYCKSKGKQYKDYRATLMQWVNRKIGDGKLKELPVSVEYDHDEN